MSVGQELLGVEARLCRAGTTWCGGPSLFSRNYLVWRPVSVEQELFGVEARLCRAGTTRCGGPSLSSRNYLLWSLVLALLVSCSILASNKHYIVIKKNVHGIIITKYMQV